MESCGGGFFLRTVKALESRLARLGGKFSPDAGRVCCPSSEKRSNFLSRLTRGRELGRLGLSLSSPSSGSPASGSSIAGSEIMISLCTHSHINELQIIVRFCTHCSEAVSIVTAGGVGAFSSDPGRAPYDNSSC